jgi:hypothetical protein
MYVASVLNYLERSLKRKRAVLDIFGVIGKGGAVSTRQVYKVIQVPPSPSTK